ncbi:MAG: peptide-methionine (S)-S-oxide reductase MsrA [Pseudomonadota bacterium]
MISTFTNLKAVVLAGLVGLGLGIQFGEVKATGTNVVVVAGGCFWCVEKDFESVRGVSEVVSGFTGGSVDNPSYKDVVKGGTGHYEAVQIFYNPSEISAAQLFALFVRSIDPTDAGGQFCDRGDSYRSAIFVSNSAERASAQAALTEAQRELGQQIVTPILDAGEFFPADAYHQDYYKQTAIILTRFGPKSKAKAYMAYRAACGRDERVRQLWGTKAPFVS